MLKDLRAELATGENVLLDVRNLTAADTQALRQAVEDAGLADRVKLWP
jgi:hypothetical protein